MKKWVIEGTKDWTDVEVKLDGKNINEEIEALRIIIKTGDLFEVTIANPSSLFDSYKPIKSFNIKNLKIEFEECD